ncbi:hypothetical protein D3C80_1098280 [compost metagenome]
MDRTRRQRGDAEITQEQYDERADGQQGGEMPLGARQLQEAAGKHADDDAHDKAPQRKHRRFTHQRGERIPAKDRRHQQARRKQERERLLLRHERHETEKQNDRGELVEQIGAGRHGRALIGGGKGDVGRKADREIKEGHIKQCVPPVTTPLSVMRCIHKGFFSSSFHACTHRIRCFIPVTGICRKNPII